MLAVDAPSASRRPLECGSGVVPRLPHAPPHAGSDLQDPPLPPGMGEHQSDVIYPIDITLVVFLAHPPKCSSIGSSAYCVH